MTEMEDVWITEAEHVKEHEVLLYFNNGTSGKIDLKDYLTTPIFEPLKDVQYFKGFKLNSWTIYWENGADFAPEFLYKKAKFHQHK